VTRQKSKKKGFGLWTGLFVVAASMAGSGILTNSGPVLKTTQSYPALFILWALGGVCSVLGAMTLSEISTGLPRSGGDYVFVRSAFGPAIGFVYGWAMVLLGFSAPIALVAYTTANFLAAPLDMAQYPLFVNASASCLIIGFTISHCFSHQSSAWVQGFTTIFKLGTFLIFAVVGFFGEGSLQHIWQSQPLSAVSFPQYANGLILVLYAYTGWNAVSYLAGELRTPQKNLPLCLIGGTLAVTAIYILFNAFYAYALDISQINQLTDGELNRLGEMAVLRSWDSKAANLFSVLIGMGVLSSLSVFILTGPRVVYAMAQDKIFPKQAGMLHPESGVPVRATLFQGVFALIFLWSGTFEEVLNFTGYGLALLSALVVGPIFVLRRRKDFRPTYRVPGYPFTPLVFLIVSGATLIGSALHSPWVAMASVGSILLGFPLYFASKALVKPQ
jgi:basic amino acid/polyamine antiporter, APA family